MESNIYSECKPVCTNTYFPTVLELLDIDLPMLERVRIISKLLDSIILYFNTYFSERILADIRPFPVP